MKKFLIIVLTVILAAAACLTASAEERRAPTYPAEKSLIKGVTDHFWTNSLRSHSRTVDHDYGEKLTDTYNGKKIVWGKAGEGEISATNVDIYLDYGMGKVGFGGKAITLNGELNTDDSIYVVIFGYQIDPEYSGTVKSFMLAVPGDDTLWGACAPDGFTLFESDTAWNETETYSKTFKTPTTTEFTEVAKVENLNSGNKWVNDPSGKFKYYEADFDTEISKKYLVMAFTVDDFASISAAVESKKITSAIYAPTEFAVFGEKVTAPAATEEPKPTEAPEATEEPVATEEPAPTDEPEATEAPVSTEDVTPTENPGATEAPKPTEEQNAAEAPKTPDSPSEDKKSGCGSVMGSGLVILGTLALTVLKKKENT